MKWKNKGHEFDEVGEQLTTVRTVYFYGIGGHVKEIYEAIKCAEQWIDWTILYVDRNEEIQKRGFEGKRVLSPKELYTHIATQENEYLVVACPLGNVGQEIKNLVIQNGVDSRYVTTGFDFLYTLLPLYFLYKYDMVFFSSQNIVPSSACNLNCRECLNFNPFIKKPVIHPVGDVERDIDIFFNAVDLIYRFQVTGGEPLLYPQIREVLEYIYDNYENKIFRLETVTNGTILPDDDMCRFLSDLKVYVFLDDYSMALTKEYKEKRKKIVDKFERFNVSWSDNYVDRWFKLYPSGLKMDEFGLESFFDMCSNPWSTIEDGKVTACNYALYATKAGINQDCVTDYYDLSNFNGSKKKELVEFRLRCNEKGYTSFCDKCAGFSVINDDWYYPAIQVGRGYFNEME